MRRVIASGLVSLDGVMEEPSWPFPFTDGTRDAFKFEELSAAGALPLGRATYQGFAAAWPGKRGRDDRLKLYGRPRDTERPDLS